MKLPVALFAASVPALRRSGFATRFPSGTEGGAGYESGSGGMTIAVAQIVYAKPHGHSGKRRGVPHQQRWLELG